MSILRDMAWASVLLVGSCALTSAQTPGKFAPVSPDNLCVTEGALGTLPGGRLSVDVSKMRAYVRTQTAAIVEVRFKYLGGTAEESRLGSGEVRRQFGLKLRAQDACNLVYAMWRIEPENKIVVSSKSNPSQHTSAECGNRGYRNIKPTHNSPVPAMRAGESHTLRAEMLGTEMKVLVDNRPVWEGSLGAVEFDGPVGMRSDNAKLEVELLAPPGAGKGGLACKKGPE